MQNKFICFGEMLWDMLPTGKMPGGAPMNVAIHLKNFGNNVAIISRVGTDDLGTELIDFVRENGLNSQYIQQGQNHLTGLVKVNMDDKHNVSYKIVQPVAWDYILYDEEAIDTVKNADCFVFGSLAARSEQTFDTLKKFLAIAPFKVLDINLRPPYYKKETIKYLLQNTDLLKLNQWELDEVAAWFFDLGSIEENINNLSRQFNINTICVTLGAEGAVLLHENNFYKSAGFEVAVIDTIGSGDSFLASFLSNYFNKTDIGIALVEACAMGALVATKHGASPKITKAEIEYLISGKNINHNHLQKNNY